MEPGHALQHRVPGLLKHTPQGRQRLLMLPQFRQRHGEQGIQVRQRGLQLERSTQRRDRRRELALLEVDEAQSRVDLGDRAAAAAELQLARTAVCISRIQRAFAGRERRSPRSFGGRPPTDTAGCTWRALTASRLRS